MQIEFTQGSTKLQQLIDSLSVAIGQERFRIGESLPSINQLSNINQVSRDTVFKTYQELKRRGLIDSTPAKGYYVAGTTNKVFMLLDTFSPFKDVLYNAVVSNLPKGYTIDLLFHHHNPRVFESAINDSLGRYNAYVVMNFNNDRISETLRKIDSGKLLILDWGKYADENYAFACQDFDKALYECLDSGWELIRKYKKMVMYLPESSPHPRSCVKYFKAFCNDRGIQSEVVTRLEESGLERGTAYLVIPQKELVEMLKFCRGKRYRLGHDIGLIAYNDTPVYEIIDEGITVISTDFVQMGQRAAHFIRSKQKIQEIIPTRLIVRGTL